MIMHGCSICENKLMNDEELNGRSEEVCVNFVNEK